MQFDMLELDKAHRYKIMASCITPRPIAWVTSASASGLPNAAPYSFFNMMGDDPPTVALGLLSHAESRLKDTANNIRETGEFVVNLVDEDHAAAMNVTCMDAPPDVDELACAGVSSQASVRVACPRIASAPASFECLTRHVIQTGLHQIVVIGEVIFAHVADRFIQDPERLHIDTPAMRLLARMHGSGWYSRQTDLLQHARPTWAEWSQAHASDES